MYPIHNLKNLQENESDQGGVTNSKSAMNFQMKQSLAQRVLPEELWAWLSVRTSFGTTIYECVKSGIENPDSKIGLYAPGKSLRVLMYDNYI